MQLGSFEICGGDELSVPIEFFQRVRSTDLRVFAGQLCKASLADSHDSGSTRWDQAQLPEAAPHVFFVDASPAGARVRGAWRFSVTHFVEQMTMNLLT